MKNFLRNGGLVLAGSLAGLSTASAALPASVTDATTGAFAVLLTDSLAMIDLVWTVAIPVTVGFILIRMFKRGASSAT